MATVLEERTTEGQRFVVLFCGQEDSVQRIFTKKCFLFTVGSVYRVKRFTARSKILSGRSKVDDGARPGAEVAETKDSTWYAACFEALVKRWDKCINVGGGYVEK
jgi:hypothetical protein